MSEIRPQKGLPRPTDAELQILQVLWQLGPTTVREVHEALSPTTGTGYTTVLKMLQIMLRKGLVTRTEDNRSHIYCAAESQDVAQKGLIKDFIHRAFEGSSSQLVMQAMSAQPPTAEELAEIRQALAAFDKQEKE